MTVQEKPQVISYYTLQRALGIIGVSLPIILLIGSFIVDDCREVQRSISNYYYTNMGNVFVGYLCSIGLFLWAYKGYPGAKWDNIAGNIACIFALGVAFLPTSVKDKELTACILHAVDNGVTGTLHLISACSLLIILASFSLFIFTKGAANPTSQKLKRNSLYRICGYVMLGCILLMGIYIAFLRDNFPDLENLSPIFWLETFSLWAFGFSWLTKGGIFLKDK